MQSVTGATPPRRRMEAQATSCETRMSIFSRSAAESIGGRGPPSPVVWHRLRSASQRLSVFVAIYTQSMCTVVQLLPPLTCRKGRHGKPYLHTPTPRAGAWRPRPARRNANVRVG